MLSATEKQNKVKHSKSVRSRYDRLLEILLCKMGLCGSGGKEAAIHLLVGEEVLIKILRVVRVIFYETESQCLTSIKECHFWLYAQHFVLFVSGRLIQMTKRPG